MQYGRMVKRFWHAAALMALVLPAHAETASSPPIVVELFTSQGCSSCPPADAYLGQLAHRPGILALGFHIDYWNYIGWTDPYSLPLAAARQRAYGERLGLHYVYTPQMIIDGSSQEVGSKPNKIAPLLAAAQQRPQAGPVLSVEKRGGAYHVHVGAGNVATTATVWLVGIDRQHETKVLRGENEGATAHDYQVVRSFKSIGAWHGQPLDLDVAEASVAGDEVAVLLQVGGTGRILTAAMLQGSSS